jgi:murein DD-endopeptidase MepM/ murein hydrolase activator NlpD
VRTFTFVGAVFPVRGPHTFGEGAARFGAERAGHVHQGQDVMARCGTPLVAARGGVVVQRAFQALAGNYVVIQDPITGESNVYAHLRRPASVRRGQRVETGQPIGVVGETGDATACHLHFELWTAPGWYRGGSPIDPLPTLQGWDRLG